MGSNGIIHEKTNMKILGAIGRIHSHRDIQRESILRRTFIIQSLFIYNLSVDSALQNIPAESVEKIRTRLITIKIIFHSLKRLFQGQNIFFIDHLSILIEVTFLFNPKTMLSLASSKEKYKDLPESEIKVLFPEIIENKINTVEFLIAARGIVKIVDKLGKVFAPVKYDIQGNIDKLATKYATNEEQHATLQDMILIEKVTETRLVATDALLWLSRGLHMILLFFEKIVEDSKADTPTEDLVAFLKKSYKEALEPYHGWMAQQLFDLLSRMVPTRTQLLQALNSEQADTNDTVISNMEIYLIHLRQNVSVIQLFYKTHNLESMI